MKRQSAVSVVHPTGSGNLEVAKHPGFQEHSRMNTNVRLTFARRLEMVRDITEHGLSVPEAAASHSVTPSTARKWLGRYLAGGVPALADAASQPVHSSRAIDSAKALLIVELQQQRLLPRQLARGMGVSESTVSRVLARAGLSKLSGLQSREPVVRYELAASGDLLHIDTTKLGRNERPGHRVTGDRRNSGDGASGEMLFVAVDDHARIAFTTMHPDEKKEGAVQFLRDAVAYYGSLGVTVRRLLTDHGAPFRSREFARACQALGIRHEFTRAYRPQTNGRAERFIQSALRDGSTPGRISTLRGAPRL